jgi:adenylosuccinate synthase
VIQVATAYRLDGEVLDRFPADLDDLARVQVEYTALPGWQTSIEGVRKYEDLPENCRHYVEWIEGELGVPIEWIGVGPAREAMIHKAPGAKTVGV